MALEFPCGEMQGELSIEMFKLGLRRPYYEHVKQSNPLGNFKERHISANRTIRAAKAVYDE